MTATKNKLKSIFSLMMALLMMAGAMSFTAVPASAEGTLEAGTYTVDASLSCYINAMGGVEFGAKLFNGMTVEVKDDGTRVATLNFKDDSSLNIYGINCHCFVNADKALPGFYDAEGTVNTTDVVITKSDKIAVDHDGTEYNYLETMTYTLPSVSDTYNLWLYVDSQVMGVQFCDGSGTASTNQPGEATKYVATLTVDWDSAKNGSVSTQSANVVLDYTSSGTYEVVIPATITVEKATMTGEYTVKAQNFDISDSAYVTVTADESGNLYKDGKGLAFTNELADGQLKKTGDSLAGKVTVTGIPSAGEGTYSGILNFKITYVSGN